MDGVGVSRTRPDPCTQHRHCRRAVLPWPSQSKAMGIADMYLAAESSVDHKTSHGSNRYVMHGSGGRSALRLGTELAEIISEHFPSFVIGEPATITRSGKPITVASNVLNDCKKAKSVLGATIRRSRTHSVTSSRALSNLVS